MTLLHESHRCWIIVSDVVVSHDENPNQTDGKIDEALFGEQGEMRVSGRKGNKAPINE